MTSNQQRMSNALARRLARLTLAGFACMALLAATGSRAETVRLGGTGSGLGVARLLGQAYAKTLPGFELHVVPSLGSAGGIKAVAQGATQIAVISRPLKAEEAAAGLRAFEIGRTAFVLATTKDATELNTLSPLAFGTFERVALAYQGGMPALRGLDFHVPAGTLAVIAGAFVAFHHLIWDAQMWRAGWKY